jgi:hypothetical protein
VRAVTVAAMFVLAALPTAIAEAQTTPLCFGREATIVGTDSRDFLHGTTGTDVIAALGSRDDISGSPSNTRDLKDFLCGGGHNDTISGGPGSDSLAGEDGKDRPSGGWGNDTILGGAGADRLKPGAGADFADGGPGTDIIDNENDAEPGVDERDDLLRGGIGNDKSVLLEPPARMRSSGIPGTTTSRRHKGCSSCSHRRVCQRMASRRWAAPTM